MHINRYSRAKKLIGVATLTALLNACASAPEYRTVTDHKIKPLGDSCKVQDKMVEKAVPIFTEKEEKKIADGDIERRVAIVTNTIEKIYENADCRNVNLMTMLAQSAKDPVTQAGILVALNEGSEELQQFMQWGIAIYGLDIGTMENNVQAYHDTLVREQIADVSELFDGDKPLSGGTYRYILDELYTGEAFPDTTIPLADVQALVEAELVEAGTNMKALRGQYELANAKRSRPCEATTSANGTLVMSCSAAQPAAPAVD